MPEQLYNGIVLPDEWPPVIVLGEGPLPTPYLDHPPEVIPIDVGRQLFVDDFLIGNLHNVVRLFHKLDWHPKPVLEPRDNYWESPPGHAHAAAMPFSDGVWFDPKDGKYKMWYFAGWEPDNYTCYAESLDGMTWERPALGIVPGTNIVMKHAHGRDSGTVWLDHDSVSPDARFKMSCRDNEFGLHHIYYSPDGVTWSDRKATMGATADRSTMFYNPFRRVWCFSLKSVHGLAGVDGVRFRRYAEGSDIVSGAHSWPHMDGANWWDSTAGINMAKEAAMWVRSDNADDPLLQYELYDLDAVAYESVMVGMFVILRDNFLPGTLDKDNDIRVGFSRDGFHWDRQFREPVLQRSMETGAWNASNVQPVGGCFLVVGDRLHFYCSARGDKAGKLSCSTGLATLRRDGFASLYADPEGAVTTRPVRFSGKYLFVNVDAPIGSLWAEVLDVHGNVIEPFSRSHCVEVSHFEGTSRRIVWNVDGAEADLGTLAGTNVRFRFLLRKCGLYSFWVSRQLSGVSGGYVAAGGPGFVGSIDR